MERPRGEELRPPASSQGGGFERCPQILQDTSLQEVGLNSLLLECGVALLILYNREEHHYDP